MATVQSVVAVKDTAAQAFMRPFFVPSNAVALRSFKDEVNRDAADNSMFAHPEDFELYQVGTFDDASGKLAGLEPQLIARAKDLKES